MRPSRLLFGALTVLLLGACSERYIASAGATSLVVVDDLVVTGDSAVARVIHVLPPDGHRPLTGKAALTRMDDHINIDCGKGRYASRGQRFILADGEILDLPATRLNWLGPKPGTVSADILDIACDPEKAKAASTRNSLRTVIRRYKAALN